MGETISVSRAYWLARDAEEAAKKASAASAASAADTAATSRSAEQKTPPRAPLGLSSFNAEEQHAFGRKVRLAMALIDDPDAAGQVETQHRDSGQRTALPDDPEAIAARLRVLCRHSASNLAEQLELLLRFDEQQGWKRSGAVHCSAWMNQELGISLKLGWEYLRVARKLRALPLTRALFRAGRLSWSIVRLLSRVATVDTEALLCHSALDASVSEVERLCSAYRWTDDPGVGAGDGDGGGGSGGADKDALDAENRRALQQFIARSLTWRRAGNGNTEFRLCLPPDLAEAFLNGIEHSLSRLELDRPQQAADSDTDHTVSQKRADAAVLMAEASLQSDGREMATADRYQVVINVDAGELGDAVVDTSADSNTPSRRPMLQGHTPIARETARRHACDCSVSTITMSGDGEPIDIGRKSRIWPAAMARAIKARDQHCQFPGCTATRHLQIHHITHWADGGSTSVDNGVCLCSRHHTFVHEGGYRIERVSAVSGGRELQFKRQQVASSNAPSEEIALRNSRQSFERVRRHAPTRFRFRVVDSGGADIRERVLEDTVLSLEKYPEQNQSDQYHSNDIGNQFR